MGWTCTGIIAPGEHPDYGDSAKNMRAFARRYFIQKEISRGRAHTGKVTLTYKQTPGEIHFSRKLNAVRKKRVTRRHLNCIQSPRYGMDSEIRTMLDNCYRTSPDGMDTEARRLDKYRKEAQKFDSFPGDNDDVTTRSQQDVEALRILHESRRKVGGHYEISVLWKPGEPDFVSNYPMALRRLESLERSYHFKDPVLRAAFWQHIKEWIEKGYFVKVPPELMRIEQEQIYPVFPVVRQDKTTTKIRPVLDGAAKFQGKCINDAVYKGPNVINNLPSVLTRFRKYKIALGGDVAEMFLQVKNKPIDRQYQRILFRENPGDPIQMFEPTVHVFGNAGSPCIAIFCITEHAREHEHLYPRAADAVINSSIVDDIMDSVETESEAIRLYKDLKKLFDGCGMNIRKFMSNSDEVLKNIPAEDLAKNIDIVLGDLATADVPYTIVKALGMIWMSKPDIFTFCFDRPEILREDFKWTKREVLRVQHQIYDPLGLIGPFILLAKWIMQSLWQNNYGWDERIAEAIVAVWKEWLSHLVDLPKIKIQRCLIPVAVGVQLHIFADASELAYGAVIYVVSGPDNARTSNIVCANTRIVSKVGVTIPRLELCAALLATQMAFEVTTSLKINDRHFWTDSSNVLYWLTQHDKQRKLFVVNRVTKILGMTKDSEWNWVPGPENPADIASRGAVISDLGDFWFKGPEFLLREKEFWPEQPNVVVPDKEALVEDKLESPPTKLATMRSYVYLLLENKGWAFYRTGGKWVKCEMSPDAETHPYEAEKYSTLTKAINAVTRLTAWIEWARLSQPKPPFPTYRFSKRSRYGGFVHLIRQSQRQSFTDVYETLTKVKPSVPVGHRLSRYNPYLSSEGIIKADGRLSKTKLPADQKFPIILDGKSHFTQLLIDYYHRIKCLHYGGVNHLFATLAKYFIILGGRRVIKNYLRKCVTCIRAHPHPTNQIMSPLPDYRVPKEELTAPFLTTGIDCAGPFRCASRKVWVVVFTCAEYRAVHFEPLSEMSTECFLLAFQRFASIRGMPERVVSDNGTNLVGAANRLGNLKFELNCKLLKLSVPAVEWIFTTPHCPHAGGFFERMVQSMKSAFHKIIGGHLNPSIEYFITALYQAADVINSRPLTHLSDDFNDLQPITPNHFLRMWKLDKNPICPGVWFDQVYRKLGRIMADLKRQFVLELVPTLHEFPKGWRSARDDFKVGEIVLLIEVNHVGTWPLARITKVYPGADGRVRHVDLEVALPKAGKHLLDGIRPVKDESKLRWRSRKCPHTCDFYKTILKRDIRRIVSLNIEDNVNQTENLGNSGKDQGQDPDSDSKTRADDDKIGAPIGNSDSILETKVETQAQNPDSDPLKGAKIDIGALVGIMRTVSEVKVSCTCQYRRLTFEKWVEIPPPPPPFDTCLATGKSLLEVKKEVKPEDSTSAYTQALLSSSEMTPRTSFNSEKENSSLKTLAPNDTLLQIIPVIKVSDADLDLPGSNLDIQGHVETVSNVFSGIFSEPKLICHRS